MDQIQWTSIFKTNKMFEAELMKNNLEHSGIPCAIINKQDRSYLAFGEIEVHVPEEQKEEAFNIINQKSADTE
ncbi:MAG: DUF2007 domain-containing protein [Chitinophagaceae bacterium]|jgi:hypothetical protein